VTSLWLAATRQAIDRTQESRCELSKNQTSAIAAVIADGAFNNLADAALLSAARRIASRRRERLVRYAARSANFVLVVAKAA
jgi:hypothetical protein